MTKDERLKLWEALRNADAVRINGTYLLTKWIDGNSYLQFNWADSDDMEFQAVIELETFLKYANPFGEYHSVITIDSDGGSIGLRPFKFVDLI